MSSLNTPSPVGDATSVASLTPSLPLGHHGEVVKTGNLKKLKTMKRKFFVLRCESSEFPARLEYYDSEKKFRAHQAPKRSISLKACFNINRIENMKQKYVIALYTKDDRFCIILDSEEERESWLRVLWTLQNGDNVIEGEIPKPLFEHVWKVVVANKGLGATRNINGNYHLCLTGKTVSLVKILPDGKKETLEFPLQNIRSFGSVQSFFYMEVGRNAVTGTGEIWMEVEDDVIAKDMNNAISAMRKSDDSGSKQIGRSASVSESSRPISMATRRLINSNLVKYEETGSSVNNDSGVGVSTEASTGSVSNIDSYCEMHRGPMGMTTTDSDGSALSRTGSVPYNFVYCQTTQRTYAQQPLQQGRLNTNFLTRPNQRRHSVSAVSVSTPGVAGCKGGPLGPGPAPPLVHHHQRTYSFPLSPLPPSTSVRRASTGAKAGQRVGGSASGAGTGLSSAHCSSAGRDRSDSLPSTTRTPNDAHPFPQGHYGHHVHHTHPRNVHSHFIPASHRPHSMCGRGISHSPPVGSSPVSPASGACSTDSAGSSLSIDEGDNWDGLAGDVSMGSISRYTTNHPLTPESPIEEENCDDYVHWNGPSAPDSGVGEEEKVNNYMPMDRSTATLSLPIHQPLSGRGPGRKFSPGRGGPPGAILKSGSSPSHGSYMEMSSPCGSSPLDTPGNYMIMSPGALPDSARTGGFYNRAPSSSNHSRASSLAEETPDGYTPMMPGQTDDGYVGTDHPDGHEDLHHGEMSPTSSCSITSGTPSTDLRFSEYPLEKVNSYFTPSEEEETGERPTRCYSVGSKPDSLNKKNRLDIINQTDCSRVRAFSVGSRNAPGSKLASRPLGHDIHATRHTLQTGGHFTPPNHQRLQQQPGVGKMSSSAPILSNSFTGSPMNRQLLGGSHSSVEPMDDLMEMDFSQSVTSTTKSGRSKNTSKTGGRSKSTTVNDYLSMSPAERDRLSVPGGTSHHSSQSSVASSYSTAEGGDSIGPGSPPKPSVLRSVFNSIGRSPPEPAARSPPNRSAASPRSAVARMSSISELKPQNFPTTTPSPPIKPSLLATSNSATSMAAKMAKMAVSAPYVEMSPSASSAKPVIAMSAASKAATETSSPYVEMKGRPCAALSKGSSITTSSPASNEDYLDMSFKPRRTSVPECQDSSHPIKRTSPLDTPNTRKTDGYVEMGWRSSMGNESDVKHPILNKLPGHAEDYMNMSGGYLSNNRTRKERRGSKRDRSQPINIQQPQQNRKIAMETPPKVPPGFLALGTSSDSQSPLSSPFSSLGRNRSRKSSKDSCGSTASDLTSPSGSNSTIFPLSLNSPGSPLKPFTPDGSTSATILEGVSSFDNLEKVPADMSSGTLRLSYPYVEMSPKISSAASPSLKQDLPKHDYVNYSPNSIDNRDKPAVNKIEDDSGDYAVMCPVSASNAVKSEPVKKIPPDVVSAPSKAVNQILDSKDYKPSLPSYQSNDQIRPSSKPLTVSSLLGMNNLSPDEPESQPQNNLSQASNTSEPTSKFLSNSLDNNQERKKQNCDPTPVVPSCANTASVACLTNTTSSTPSDGNVGETGVPSDDGSTSAVPSNAAIVYPSPNLSPCPSPSPNPSPSSEGSASHTSPAGASGCAREKKMSSGSDSSTASRDSQLLVRKYSAGSVSPGGTAGKNKSVGNNNTTPANRRLSCPTKSSVSRQTSVSSEVSEVSQTDESRLSMSGMSLSRQTSSSSASGETSTSLGLTEKRSLSCSPVPTSASPIPRPAEKEINYASLDLRQGSESDEATARSPRSLKSQGSLNESQSSTSSPSPNPPGRTFTYAQIDFERSDELRLAKSAKP